MNNEQTVSVIITAYNSSQTIIMAINSVLAQTLKPLEIIVIDDCSLDQTHELVENLKLDVPNLFIIKTKANSGSPAHPRNLGTMNAVGNWIAFLDADDVWHPKKLEMQINILMNSEFTVCSTQIHDFIDAEKISFMHFDESKIKTEIISFKSQLIKYRTPLSSIVLRKDIAMRYPFPENLKYSGREDFLCMLKIHEIEGGSVKILHPFVAYRVHKNQLSSPKLEMWKKQTMILKEYRLQSGSALGSSAYLSVLLHIILSVYYRVIASKL